METKFAVGQVWKNRNGELRIISDVRGDAESYPVWSYTAGTNEELHTHKSSGAYTDTESPHGRDLVELVTNADGSPAASSSAITSLTPGEAYGATRIEFIERITRDTMFKAMSMHQEGHDVSEAIEAVKQCAKAALALRDELVRGS